MLENSRASNSRVFIGVLSKFPKLKTSVFRIAGQRFIRWMRVILSLSNLYLNCNHCKHYFAHILNSRQHGEKNNFGRNISNTRKSVSSGYPNPEKWVEKTRRSRVFLTDFEVFGDLMKHSFEFLVWLLKPFIILGEIQRKSSQNFMLIKIRYPNHRHGRDFLCFLFMNY